MNNIRKSSLKKETARRLYFMQMTEKCFSKGVSVIIVIVRKFNLEMSFRQLWSGD
jgi:hypothetical protein